MEKKTSKTLYFPLKYFSKTIIKPKNYPLRLITVYTCNYFIKAYYLKFTRLSKLCLSKEITSS